MKPDDLLNQAENTLAELKILMSSFNPDSKFAELVKQATMNAHKESDIFKKLHIIVALLWAILIVTIIGFTMGAVFIAWLAK